MYMIILYIYVCDDNDDDEVDDRIDSYNYTCEFNQQSTSLRFAVPDLTEKQCACVLYMVYTYSV